MTGINHVTTGAFIATIVSQPLLAIPLAFLSHFVLDTLPHYGHETDERYWLTKTYSKVLAADVLLIIAFFMSFAVFQPQNWLLLTLCGFVALTPDLLWIPYYLHDRRNPESKERSRISKVLKRIQMGERPWGFFVELAWLIVFASLLWTAIH